MAEADGVEGGAVDLAIGAGDFDVTATHEARILLSAFSLPSAVEYVTKGSI